MTRDILFVAVGGMLGSLLRFLVAAAVANGFAQSFPLGTFLVNVVGCFLIGAVVGLVERGMWLNEGWRLFLAVGFCGGFTTFSAFALENLQLLIDRSYSTFAAYSIASFVCCLAACFLGLVLTRG